MYCRTIFITFDAGDCKRCTLFREGSKGEKDVRDRRYGRAVTTTMIWEGNYKGGLWTRDFPRRCRGSETLCAGIPGVREGGSLGGIAIEGIGIVGERTQSVWDASGGVGFDECIRGAGVRDGQRFRGNALEPIIDERDQDISI